jgi:hypothetical protein
MYFENYEKREFRNFRDLNFRDLKFFKFRNLILFFENLELSIKGANVTSTATTTTTTHTPEMFFHEIKCFKCDKFSTKLKSSLFTHLSSVHQFDAREIDKLFDAHIQRQLVLIDKESLVEKFEKKQADVMRAQANLLCEIKVKTEMQIQQLMSSNKEIVQTQLQMLQHQLQENELHLQQQQQLQVQQQQQQQLQQQQLQQQQVQLLKPNEIIIANATDAVSSQSLLQANGGQTTFLVQTANGSIVQATAVLAGNTVNVNTNNLNQLQEAAIANSASSLGQLINTSKLFS